MAKTTYQQTELKVSKDIDIMRTHMEDVKAEADRQAGKLLFSRPT